MPPVPLSTDLITFRYFEYAVFGKEAHQGFEVVTGPRLRVTGENIVQLRLRLSHFDSSVFELRSSQTTRTIGSACQERLSVRYRFLTSLASRETGHQRIRDQAMASTEPRG